MWGAGVPGGAGSALCVTAPAPCQLFKGKFYYCEGADTRNISTRAECRAAHYRWVRRKYNFDNLGQVSATCPPSPDLTASSGWGDSSSLPTAWDYGPASGPTMPRLTL